MFWVVVIIYFGGWVVVIIYFGGVGAVALAEVGDRVSVKCFFLRCEMFL